MKKLEITIRPNSIVNLETIKCFMIQNPDKQFMMEVDVDVIDYIRAHIERSFILGDVRFDKLAQVDRLAAVIGGKASS